MAHTFRGNLPLPDDGVLRFHEITGSNGMIRQVVF
jgi:hypothetical protein